MESESKDGTNKLSKNIKDQNLKFSVEFQNGEHGGAQEEYEDDFETADQPLEQTEGTKTGGDKKKGHTQQEAQSPVFKTELEDRDSPYQANRKRDIRGQNKTESKGEVEKKDTRKTRQTEDQHTKADSKTNERLERKRKWNTKTDDNANKNEADDTLKLPPIQSRYSPQQSTPSNRGETFYHMNTHF